MRTFEYVITTALALAFAAWVATTAIHAVENSFQRATQVLAQAQRL